MIVECVSNDSNGVAQYVTNITNIIARYDRSSYISRSTVSVLFITTKRKSAAKVRFGFGPVTRKPTDLLLATISKRKRVIYNVVETQLDNRLNENVVEKFVIVRRVLLRISSSGIIFRHHRVSFNY